MTYGISINGHGAPSPKVVEIFDQAVADLREAGSESVAGSAWGDGMSVSALGAGETRVPVEAPVVEPEAGS